MLMYSAWENSLKQRDQLYAMSSALHENGRFINSPVQVNGTTMAHLTNEGPILSNHGLALPPVSNK